MSNYNSTLQSNNTDLQAILNQINELPEATGGEQATPVISVSSNGLITATAGTKSATKQLAFQAAKTITPTATSQIAVSSGYYTGGNITVAGDSNLVPSNIVSGKSIFGVTGTATAGDDPFALPFTYTVSDISGAQYGFTKNSNGYYESQNKGQDSSYAICRVNLIVTRTCDIVFDVINYAESNWDYAVFGNLDSALALSNSADSSAKKNFKGQQSASVVNVTYNEVTTGNHYIDIKFIKDGSTHSNNDSVQFKLQEQSGLSQETINKILAADTDLVAENIKSGVNIFGVIGNYGDTSMEDGLITGEISIYSNNRVKTIYQNTFYSNQFLKSVNFPACTTIGQSAFHNCGSLSSVNFPLCTTIYTAAFDNCDELTSINFPACTSIWDAAFKWCTNLTTASFPMCRYISGMAFAYCSGLSSIYLTRESVCYLYNSQVFTGTGITSTTGSIFVPSSLVASYKSNTNWAYFSNRIFSAP